MNSPVSAIWTRPLPDTIRARLRQVFPAEMKDGPTLQVFFRADDIALVDPAFSRLMQLFGRHAIPLCLAVVPDWLDAANWERLQQFEPENPLWCWHQHGRVHVNHATEGKKSEFGDSRSRKAIRSDIEEGRYLLVRKFGKHFCQVFTPPWNRCGLKTLETLPALGFRAVSRSAGARPPAGGIIPDLAVNVDLHTRKENDSTAGWQNLLEEFARAAATGRIGVMLHHQRMNEAAFDFLDLFLAELRSRQNIICCSFRDML